MDASKSVKLNFEIVTLLSEKSDVTKVPGTIEVGDMSPNTNIEEVNNPDA